eukprot:Seg246.7 transcript_id=Seg246.7/GoldUCD/mRNA.D3Y31 product="hypothetical protein" protein_id=Seg246.7/GoldUCD/D3Y31
MRRPKKSRLHVLKCCTARPNFWPKKFLDHLRNRSLILHPPFFAEIKIWNLCYPFSLFPFPGSSRSFLSGNQSELQRSFIEMVYNLPVIEKDLTESLTFVCHRDDINITVKKHIIHVLYCCCQKKTTMHLSLFLSFTTSVILGYSMKNFEKLQQSDGDNEMSETKRLKYKIISGPKEKVGMFFIFVVPHADVSMPIMVARSITGVSQVLCANDKSSKPSKTKATKAKKSSEKGAMKAEENLFPADQAGYEKYIETYRNEEQFKYDFYSYYDIENELLNHRQPQPKKPALY